MDDVLLDMIKRSKGMEEKYDALQKLQAAPIERGLREQGQSTKDFFLKPSGAQNRAMLEMAGGILNRDRTKPGMAGINEGYRRGLDLMDEIRQREKDDKIRSATLDIAQDKDQWGRMTDMLKLAPKPEKANVGQKYFWNAKTNNVLGAREVDGDLHLEDGSVVHPNYLTRQGYTPLTASSGNLSSSDFKPGTPSNDNALMNLTAAEKAFTDLEEMLEGDWTSDAKAIAQGTMKLPTDVGRRWRHAQQTVRNTFGRLESGGTIRKDEQKDYEERLVPTLLDLGSPEVIEQKIKMGKAISRIEAQIQTGEITRQEGRRQLLEVMNSTSESAGEELSESAKGYFN